MIGTYNIIKSINNKYYIGSSININKRLTQHKSELKRNIHHCIYLQRAYNKYGKQCFTFEIEELFDTETSARKKRTRYTG